GSMQLGVVPFENGQYVRLLNRGRAGGYLFADESGKGLSTDTRREMINTVWRVQILETEAVHVVLRGAYGRHLAATPMNAGFGHIGELATQCVFETMEDIHLMWRTIPGSRAGDIVLLNDTSSLRALRANGLYRPWNTGVTLQAIDRTNARLSLMMEWGVQVIPEVQRPPFQLRPAA
uniref:DUF569 domain-containing protein n=1 Tax=Oryza brachyantha TaxID=4533 RepID=J3LSA6_ORYBR